jgi:hypothetical protein
MQPACPGRAEKIIRREAARRQVRARVWGLRRATGHLPLDLALLFDFKTANE